MLLSEKDVLESLDFDLNSILIQILIQIQTQTHESEGM